MDYRFEHGPFDIIGDIHGCYEELHELLLQLGYKCTIDDAAPSFSHAHKRKIIFLGDLVDRGPKITAVLRLVMKLVHDQIAMCVAGNHDIKLMKKLHGQEVKVAHGLKESIDQLANESDEFKRAVASFISKLDSQLLLDDGKLIVAHAGMKKELQGQSSSEARRFALYGETTGETDEYGLPVRYNWAKDYQGEAVVVYGHTPVKQPQWLNKTICIDTGCVFGGKLTALRYPENELVSVDAMQTYYEPVKFR